MIQSPSSGTSLDLLQPLHLNTLISRLKYKNLHTSKDQIHHVMDIQLMDLLHQVASTIRNITTFHTKVINYKMVPVMANQ